MRKYLESHMEQLNTYCEGLGISCVQLLKKPACYSKTEMYIQHYEIDNSGLGLNDSTPAKVILKISKVENGLQFEASDDIKQIMNR